MIRGLSGSGSLWGDFRTFFQRTWRFATENLWDLSKTGITARRLWRTFLPSPLPSLQDAAGRVTSYTYDALNRRASRTLPLSQIERYTYDAVGNLTTKTDFNGRRHSKYAPHISALIKKQLEYLEKGPWFFQLNLNRLASTKDDRVAAQGGPSTATTYSYDAVGNLAGYVYPNTV